MYFVLVLWLASNALAEDLEPPWFAGARGSGCVKWEHDVDPLVRGKENATSYGYWPEIEEPESVVWPMMGNSTWDKNGQFVWTDSWDETAWMMTPPQGEGGYLTVYAQMTYYTEPGGEAGPMLELWTGPGRDYDYLDSAADMGGIEYMDDYEIENGIRQMVVHHTYPVPEGLGGISFALSLVTTEVYEVVLDAVIHPSPVAPTGTGERPWASLTKSSGSNPGDGATDVSRDVVISWTPSKYADTHDVYLGTVFDSVNDADRTNPLGVLDSQGQNATTYDPPGRLDFGQTYFWRIDEVNAPPDYTIFQGNVWSFTVEPFAYPIDGNNITVTASSNGLNQVAENTINSSGLDANDLHSTELTAMWLTTADATGPAWIQYEFDKVCKLHQMLVWNHNGMLEPALGFGCKDVTIEYSVNGTDYTTLGTSHEFARAPGTANYAHNTTVDFGGAAAKYVRLTVNSN